MRYLQFLWIASLALAMTIKDADAQEASQKAFCRALAEYRAPAGVEYAPGVAADGHFVAPADAPGSAKPPQLDIIEIPVEIDLARRFGARVPAGLELKPVAAIISIHKDGKVEYNGQDISRGAYKSCNEEKP